MSISGDIKAHIPYLRRFSRALTGTREGGDDYVLAMLEIIVADQSKISAIENLKDRSLSSASPDLESHSDQRPCGALCRTRKRE